MDNNFTVTAAFVTAFAAIVAPTITALIHSIKEYKISKMSSTIVKRLELCEAFSDAYSSCQYGTEKLFAIVEAFGVLFFFWQTKCCKMVLPKIPTSCMNTVFNYCPKSFSANNTGA